MCALNLSPSLRCALSRLCLTVAACASLVVALEGCKISQPGERIEDEDRASLPRATELRVVAHQGGLHRGMLVVDGVWYQGFGATLLMLEPTSGAELASRELAPAGTSGGIVSLLIAKGPDAGGERLFVVLDGDAVVVLDRANPSRPVELARFTTREIGFRPREVSFAGGTVWVVGDGGAVELARVPSIEAFAAQWNAATLAKDPEKVPFPVPPSASLDGESVRSLVDAVGGPVACCGRRIKRVATGEFLGAATALLPIDGAGAASYAFVLQAKNMAEIGLKDSKFSTLDSKALHATVYGARVIDDRLYAWNDFEVASWPVEKQEVEGKVEATRLGALFSIPVRGARDVARVRSNHFAVAGSFGRSLYRFRAEGALKGDVFYFAHREPSRLEVSTTDRRRILAGCAAEGWWLWTIGESADLVTKGVLTATPLAKRVDGAWGSAQISDDGASVRVSSRRNTFEYRLDGDALPVTLALVGAQLWIGHSEGIDIVRPEFAEENPETADAEKPNAKSDTGAKISGVTRLAHFRFDGPVNAIYPNRVGGGASYCALWGGFGSIRPFEFIDMDGDGREDPKAEESKESE